MNIYRRYCLAALGLLGSAACTRSSNAHHTETHFEKESKHKLVYQCNHAEFEYLESILFSCGELLRKYGDDIELVVEVMGPGLHLLAKQPERKISGTHQQRVQSLASYGVAFHACGNTMKALNWSKEDLLDEARIVAIGVDDLMLLQEKGFSYVSW